MHPSLISGSKGVFEQFLQLRKAKDNEKAAAMCHPDVCLKSPKETFNGIEQVKQAWAKGDKEEEPAWGPVQDNGDKPFREVKFINFLNPIKI